MKHTKLVRNLCTAAILSVAAIGASAQTILAGPIIGSSFTDVLVGTISVTSLSNLTGSMFAATTVDYGPFVLTLGAVTFTNTTVGTLTGDLDPSAAGFSFTNVMSGFYQVKASGTITGGGLPDVAFIAASYAVTPVPEPESFAMLLAGLGLMGVIARRRNKVSA